MGELPNVCLCVLCPVGTVCEPDGHFLPMLNTCLDAHAGQKSGKVAPFASFAFFETFRDFLMLLETF